MAEATQVVRLDDFRGGLNLRADQVRLEPDEAADLVDFDVDPRGGFRTRRTVDNLNATVAPGIIHNPHVYSTGSGTEQLVVRRASSTLYYSTGGNFTQIPTYTPAGAVRMATFDNLLYIQDGVAAAVRWNGTALSTMGVDFSPDKTAPTNDDMPIAKFVAAWQGRMWVASTTESATAYKNRLRWSHPNKADAWMDTDYIEVDDGVDGDEITALLPFGPQLLIFKRNSVHILSGFPDDSGDTLGSLALSTLTRDAGAPDQDSVCTSPTRAYFWGWPNGVYGYDGDKLYNIFDRIKPAIRDGRISRSETPALCWSDARLYVACGWGASRTTFVLDPSVSRDGAWTRYSLPLRYLVHWQQAAANRLIMIAASGTYLLAFRDWDTAAADDFGSSTANLAPVFRSAWFDAGVLSAKKRWRSPRIMGEASTELTVRVYVYHNGDDVNRKKSIDWTVGRTADAALYGTAQYGTDIYGKADTWPDFDRVSNLGSSWSVQVEFVGPSTTYWWQVQALEIPYRQKRIR
jgi:hypothetical protein